MKKILLVEDEVSNLDMLARRLVRRGYEVVTAVDGNEALEKAGTEHPDLILMDINLPDIDGLEVTRRLRADGKYDTTPIIALTAYAFTSDRQKSVDAGCNDFMPKPVDIGKLVAIMEGLL